MGKERFTELEVWRFAYELAIRIFKVTARFPREERFGLSQQLRRAAVGVISNLAEGHARGSRKEFAHFCSIARGSQSEVQSLLMLSRDLGFLSDENYQELDDGYRRVGQMLNRLVSALRTTRA